MVVLSLFISVFCRIYCTLLIFNYLHQYSALITVKHRSPTFRVSFFPVLIEQNTENLKNEMLIVQLEQEVQNTKDEIASYKAS